MKFKIFTVLAFCASAVAFAQTQYKYGNKFDFDPEQEKDVKLVAGDNNSYYLQSSTNENSIRSNNTIYIRKFDNSNNLKETFSHEMPQMEKYAPINYLGSFESGNKIVFITETYAGKLKKKDIYKVIFDKSTSAFTDELLVSYPIESTMKSGTTYFEKSENGRYGAVVFYNHSPRKEPEKIDINVIDSGSLKSAWSKQVTAEAGSSDTDFFVTNSGNVGLLRSVSQNAMLLFVTPSGQEEKFFTEKMKVISETVVSMGSQDYLLAFNSTPKAVKFNASDFENLMLYDIQEGKIISNNVIKDYNDGTKIADVYIPYTYLSGDKIYLFTESKIDSGTRKVKSPMGTMTFDETFYRAGDPRMVVLNTTGTIESVTKLEYQKRPASPDIHSFGIINVKGNYIVKNGGAFGMNLIDLENPGMKILNSLPPNTSKDPYYEAGDAYGQGVLYRADTKTLLIPRTFNGNQASIIAIENFEGK
ncbi:hypothetical protein HNP38_003334 [Chryseobacterium defluvii]|uniref:Uncharacterized protein n=1 Tax=Chryseobacterium defluvii TaxID=160396 RepID=A0A840KK00_9FLAO|nr:hypothetical protein [Chryseobacterium defluvii]MBB4807994.1 hypothetical protein [Chryseobacterium defluvii]